MEAIQTATPESIWAILKENAIGLKELRESQKETARQMELTDRKFEETARQMKETDKKIGKLGNRFGEVVEYMVAPNLREKFKELGFIFPNVGPGYNISDHDNKIYLEIDVLLENGDKALLVEAKSKLTTEDVKEHIERLEKMRKYADLRGDRRTFLGAVASIVMTPNVKDYALKQGFFVIEPSGETFNITPPNDKPKEW